MQLNPTSKIFLTRFQISGDVRNKKYGEWIKKTAKRVNVDGYIKFLNNGNASIAIAGTKEELLNFKKIINNNQPDSYKDFTIVEKKRTSPVKNGFIIINQKYDEEIIDGYFPVRLEDPKRKNKDRETTPKNGIETQKKEEPINNKSGKLTKIFRSVGKSSK